MGSKKSNTVEEVPEVAEAKAIEDWAEAKGMLPQYEPTNFGDRVNPAYWKLASTKVFMGWQDGQRVTEQEFDEAVTKMLGLSFG